MRLAVSLPALIALLVASSLLASCTSGPVNSPTRSGVQPSIHPDPGCTILYAADDNVALGGNNEDYSNPYTYIWFVPPEPGKYGRVCFGYEDGFLRAAPTRGDSIALLTPHPVVELRPAPDPTPGKPHGPAVPHPDRRGC